MQTTIYIRKDNEDKWNNIADKSAWVNALLTNSGDTTNYGRSRDISGKEYITLLGETLPDIDTTGLVVGPDGRIHDEATGDIIAGKVKDGQIVDLF